MARKQQEIPGFERQAENPAIEEAAFALVELENEHSAIGRKKTLAMHTLLATLKAHNVPKYEVVNPETGEVFVAQIKLGKETAVVVKSGEVEDVEDESDATDTGPGEGILAQAAKAQADANVEETDDGDVTVPDKPAPKAKRKKAR